MQLDPRDIYEAQRDAEELMVDECTIERPSGSVIDETTGKITERYVTVYPSPADQAAGNNGRCRFVQVGAMSRDVEAGRATFTIHHGSVHIPIGAGPARTGDRITFRTGRYNPALAGQRYRITRTYEQSLATVQRLTVEAAP